MASIEKALLDYFYLHADIETEQDFDSLRINREMFFEKMNFIKLVEEVKPFLFYSHDAEKIMLFPDFIRTKME